MQNITTKVERHFKFREDGLFQEVFYHLIVFKDPANPSNTKQRLDHIITGKIYREGTINEHSRDGEAEFVDQNGIKHTLVAIRGPQPV